MNNDEVKRLAGTASVVFITIIVSMVGFWMMIGREFVTRSEMHNQIDRKFTSYSDKLDELTDRDDELKQIITKNTDMIQVSVNKLELLIQEIKFKDSTYGRAITNLDELEGRIEALERQLLIKDRVHQSLKHGNQEE